MKALNTETLQGNGMADLLAERIQAAYARVAGKSKIEAQIDFLSTLRTFCPFYGSTFFDVQCQYDDQPLNSTTQPPVTPMNAAVGPLAIFLMTKSNPPTVMRHPYNRIIKWIAHASKHIFTYWVIKANVRISEIEQLHSEKKKDFDIRPYCDCIYLVTSQVHEIEHVVKSYVQSASNVDPCLAGAPPELQPSATKLMSDNLVDDAVHSTIDPTTSSPPAGRTVERKQSVINITSLGMLFSSLGADVPASSPNTIIKKSGKPDILTGSGYSPKGVESEARFGDDSPGVATSMFKEAFNTSNESRSSKKKGIVDTESEPDIPSNIKYASDMAELKKVAEESQFSDDESESDENDSSDERPKSTKNQNKSTSKANASKQNNVATKDPSKQQIKSTEISSESEALLKSNGPADGKSPSQIFRRASNFFSPFAGKLNNGDVSINGSSAKAETTKTKSVDSESDAGSGSDSSNGHSSDSDTQVM